MALKNSFMLLLLLAWLTIFPQISMSQMENEGNYVRDACSVTRYRNICIRSLTPFSNTARRNPSIWARAGVSVTIGETKKVIHYLATMRASRKGKGRNRIALSDCVECFQDTLDNLHKSLGVLRKLRARDFTTQIEDVTTWVSAALTDEDTCVDGFGEQKGKRVRALIRRVSNVTYVTSNALALVNKLATTGPECLTS